MFDFDVSGSSRPYTPQGCRKQTNVSQDIAPPELSDLHPYYGGSDPRRCYGMIKSHRWAYSLENSIWIVLAGWEVDHVSKKDNPNFKVSETP
jgi:hypothetical protein